MNGSSGNENCSKSNAAVCCRQLLTSRSIWKTNILAVMMVIDLFSVRIVNDNRVGNSSALMTIDFVAEKTIGAEATRRQCMGVEGHMCVCTCVCCLMARHERECYTCISVSTRVSKPGLLFLKPGFLAGKTAHPGSATQCRKGKSQTRKFAFESQFEPGVWVGKKSGFSGSLEPV